MASRPTLSVLRDGLLMLNAGHELDDSYRALLLRAALYRRHGILTALLHQVDAERTAVIVHDAVVDPTRPLPPAELDRIVHEDVTYDIWEAYLHGELLTTARQYDPARRVLAEVALSVLDGQPLYPVLSANFHFDADSDDELTGSLGGPRLLRLASLLVALALVIMVLTFWQIERRRIDNMISMSAGVYTLIDANNATHTADLAAYFIDSMEVTNDQYRRCVAAWQMCSARLSQQPYPCRLLRRSGFRRTTRWSMWIGARPADYCEWRRKRLPSADEWQVAAGFAPATRRIHSYPWGDLYAVGLANDANAAAGDLLAGGQYRPAGDSLMGLSDMAGNAAEWTATPDAENPSAFWVKGGSFQDGPEQIRTSDGFTLPEQENTAVVGFRCAASPLAAAIGDPGLLNWRGQ